MGPKSIGDRPTLYVDVDGVLFMFGKPEVFGGTQAYNFNLRPFTTSFLYWCHKNFNCRWLTAWNDKAINLAQEIYAIFACEWPVAKWRHNKTEGIDFSEDFIWIDDDVMRTEQDDLKNFAQQGKFQQFIHVNPNNLNELEIVKTKLEIKLEEAGYKQLF